MHVSDLGRDMSISCHRNPATQLLVQLFSNQISLEVRNEPTKIKKLSLNKTAR